MPPFTDIAGQRFGRLTAIRRAESKSRRTMWECLCECGNTVIVQRNHLPSQNTRSCGCLLADLVTTHGASKTPEFRAWLAMQERCLNQNGRDYHLYGGRGISLCPRWAASFADFLSDMGPRPPGTSLDRIDNDRGYSPENCRWATPREQAANRRTSRPLTHNGRTLILAEWCRQLGLPKMTVSSRLRRGLSVAEALTQ